MVGLNKVVFLGLILCTLIIVLTSFVEAQGPHLDSPRVIRSQVVNWTNRTALQKLVNDSKGDPLIQVRNALGSAVNIYCKSEYDYLGDRRMDPRIIQHLEEYAFSFRPDVWGNGLFWCEVSWKDKNLTIQAYDQETLQSNNTFYLFRFGLVRNLRKVDVWH